MQSTLESEFKRLIELSNKLADKHPEIVIPVLHDLFRTIWLYNPPLNFKTKKDEFISCIQNGIKLLECAKILDFYKQPTPKKPESVVDVYPKLWKTLSEQNIQFDTKFSITDIFQTYNKSLDNIIGKKVLDMGCGSGRFTFGLAKIGAKEVIGIDKDITTAEKNQEKAKLPNLKFIKGDVLKLPFEDETFDFVWCKGILHHRGNIDKGLDELSRVLKQGGLALLFLYGKGGFYWQARDEMRKVFQKIPIDTAIQILKLMNMPQENYMMVDSWYVPIEEHVSKAILEFRLHQYNYSEIQSLDKRGEIPSDIELFGEGERWYFLTKSQQNSLKVNN